MVLKQLSPAGRWRAKLNSRLELLAEQLAPSSQRPSPAQSPHLRVLGELPRVEGSKPVYLLQDARQQRYIFKQCERALAAAEQAAYELRRLGGRPVVPAWQHTLQVDGRSLTGVIKRFIDEAAEPTLTTATAEWTSEQRAVMLLEHAWDWFLDNLDTNTSQYALFGSDRVPVNIDWDRSFATSGHNPMSRFAKYRATLPNAKTFLYADYVDGKFALPLGLLLDEARRIRRLPRKQVERIMRAYAGVRYEDAADQAAFVKTALLRQRRIEKECLRFVRELARERRELAGPARGWSQRLRRTSLHVWSWWQLILERVVRGAVGRTSRGILSWLRARQS